MEKQKIHSVIITLGTIVLMIIIMGIYFVTEKSDVKKENIDNSVGIGAEEETVLESQSLTFVPDEDYNYDFLEKSSEELYEEWFQCKEIEDEYYHYYIEDGILYLDEYAATEKVDENGVYIYEWKREQKIADDVIFVDYNWHRGGRNILYITEDYVLHGTGMYEDVYLKNIKFARCYADQLLVLTLEGNLWCAGKAHCIGNGMSLEYRGWELVLENVVFANLAHYQYMAITEDDSLYMWGDNSLGQFGDGSLLEDNSQFIPECYFYQQPVKVADGIEMVWGKRPGNQSAMITYGPMRTYFLTKQNELFVCGESVGDESREFTFYGEMGLLEEPIYENCTSRLYRVMVPES